MSPRGTANNNETALIEIMPRTSTMSPPTAGAPRAQAVVGDCIIVMVVYWFSRVNVRFKTSGAEEREKISKRC